MPNVVPVDIWQGTVEGGDSQTITTPAVQEDAAASPEGGAIIEEEDRVVESHAPAFLVFGGMDISGNLFNDALITVIGNK